MWAFSMVEFIVFGLTALYFLDRLVMPPLDAVRWVKTPVNGLLIGFLLLIGLQLVPMPMSWISIISPKTAELKIRVAGILEETRTSDIRPPTSGTRPSRSLSSLSTYTHATIQEGLKLIAYLAMFFLVLNTATSKKRIDAFCYLFVFLGLFEALYAIYAVFSLSPKVWWWQSRVGGARYASGTFVVSNHFAGYLEMVLGLTMGYVMTLSQKSPRLSAGLGGARAGFQRLVGLLSPESVQPKKIFFGFSGIIMGLALLLSASRGGILSFAAAMAVMAGLFFIKTKHIKFGLFALVFAVATFIYGLSVGMDPTLKKAEKTEGLFYRLYTSKTLIPMIRDYPITGVGWGNFKYVYPRYVPKDHDGVSGSGYSHNDWFEAGAEVGITGLLLMVAAYIWFLRRLIRIWLERRNRHAVGIAAGVMAGLISLGLHSFFDFNMHIPANPLTLAALLGLGYAALHRNGYESFFYRVRKIDVNRPLRVLSALFVVMAAVLIFRPVAGHLSAETLCPTEWNSTMNLNWTPEPGDIERAVSINPKNADIVFKQAETYIKLINEGNLRSSDNVDDEQSKNRLHDRAIRALETAVRLNPARTR
ncbi:O-antigen ligase family protein [Thermodesulfobacteriota bacterium]